jgi:hypothetical protein
MRVWDRLRQSQEMEAVGPLTGGLNGRRMSDVGRERRPGLKVLSITGRAENSVIGNGRLEPGMRVPTVSFPMAALAARVRELVAARWATAAGRAAARPREPPRLSARSRSASPAAARRRHGRPACGRAAPRPIR